ncbi:MAG: fluoride efflux transporter CrcB [Pseudomonadota bacterium]
MAGVLAIAAGGALGAVLRYVLVSLAALVSGGFPLGTLVVNTIGSFVIGVLAALWMFSGEPQPAVRLFFQTGLLGAFTTFSAFSLDTMVLWQNGHSYAALLNTVLNVVLCLLAVSAGLTLGAGWQK